MRGRNSMMALASAILLLFVPACNLGAQQPLSANDQVATVVALTMQAEGAPTGVVLNTPTGVSFTPTHSPAILTVSDNTNCRSGPGVNYQIVATLPAGTSVQIIARYSAENYWIVTTPDLSGNCWISGEFAAVSGSIENLPEMTPAPVKVSAAPARPSSLYYNYDCTNYPQVTVTLTWGDAANNEDGYRLYRYDVLIAELPANATQYVDTATIAGGLLTYSVEAFNAAGESPPRSESFSCK